MLNEGKKTVGN